MRIFLQFVLPFLMPSLMFLLWTFLTRSRPKKDGRTSTLITRVPWFRLILIGFALMLIGLAATAITGGMDPQGQYRAPYWKNGKIIPGEMIPKP